jgi:hypothetical protein
VTDPSGLPDGESFSEAKPQTFAKARDPNGRRYVESITANDKPVSSRIVNGETDANELKAQLEEAREKIDRDFNGTLNIAVFDAAVAPPQKVAEASMEIAPAIEPLNCAIRFDRAWYRSGDLANVEVQLSDSDGHASPALLNVQVEAIPAAEADEPSPLPAPQFVYANSAVHSVPLVFDNAVQQEQQIQESLSQWQAAENQSQRNNALFLLGGSAMGLGLLVVAGTRKWLPGPRVWLPIAVLLAGSSVVGFYWLQPPAQLTVASLPSPTPLPTYGVRSEPFSHEVPSDEPVEFKEMEESLKEDDALKQIVELDKSKAELGFDDYSLPALELKAADDTLRLGDKVQPLPAMNEWAALARSSDRTEFFAFRAKGSGGVGGAVPNRLDRFGFGLSAGVPGTPAEPTADTPTGGPAVATTAAAVAGQSPEPGGRTLFWNPAVTTNSAGTAKLSFPVPAGPLAYRVVIYSHNGRRMGSSSRIVPTVTEYPRQSSSE